MSIFSSASTTTSTPTSTRGLLALFAALAGISLLGATGCVGRVQGGAEYAYEDEGVYQEPVVYVTDVPVNIESYPSVYYEGSYVYYVDGRWYAPGPRGWGYYRREPRGLISYRVDFERRYPGGYGYAHGGGYAHAGGYYRGYDRRGYATPAPASRTYATPAPASRRTYASPAPASHRAYHSSGGSHSSGSHHHSR